MKNYTGARTIDGLKVLVDGAPLEERYDLKRFTTWGFEWTYEGDEPSQLALAILADHLHIALADNLRRFDILSHPHSP
jgi:hypothetical protein